MKLQGQFEGLGRGTISLFLSQRAVSHRLRVRGAVGLSLAVGGQGRYGDTGMRESPSLS